MSDPIKRVNYFAGEALLTADFQAEQAYHRTMLQYLHRGFHTPGVVFGLEAMLSGGSLSVQIGMAIDSNGKQLINTEVQTLPCSGLAHNAYFVTIRYADIPFDFNDDTGVGDYKAMQEIPTIECRADWDPSDDRVLLAIIDNTHGALTLLPQYGSCQRQHAKTQVGAVEFFGTQAKAQWVGDGQSASIAAAGAGQLVVNAADVSFAGNVSIGGMLRVESAVPGTGQLALSDSQTVRLEEPNADIKLGDTLIVSLTGAPAQLRTISNRDADGVTLTVTPAFPEVVAPDTPYDFAYVAATVTPLDIGFGEGCGALRVEADGTVTVGVPVSLPAGTSWPIVAKPDGAVSLGVGQENTDPSAIEIKPGSVTIYGDLTITGDLSGGNLPNTGQKSAWTLDAATSALTYATGDIGVRTANPRASLEVGGGSSEAGTGTVTYSEGKLAGADTKFVTEVRVGDSIAVGVSKTISATITTVGEDSLTATVDQPVPLGLQRVPYCYQRGSGDLQLGPGTISWQGRSITFSETTVVVARDTLTVNVFLPSAAWLDTATIASVQSDTLLTLTAPFKCGDVNGAQFFVNGAPIAAAGTIDSSDMTLTGTGTKFKAVLNLQPGDVLRVPPPKADNGAGNWVVSSIESDTSLTLNSPAGRTDFAANNSAFIVTRSALAVVRSTDNASISACDDDGVFSSLPPALVATANGAAAPSPNTVAINVELGQTDSAYALQVNGDVAANGTLTCTALIVAGKPINLAEQRYQFGRRDAKSVLLKASSPEPLAIKKRYEADGFIVISIAAPQSCNEDYVATMTATVSTLGRSPELGAAIAACARSDGEGRWRGMPATATLPIAAGEEWTFEFTNCSSTDTTAVMHWTPIGSQTSTA